MATAHDSDTRAPVIILGSGWRTGSTLLQRLLCSHPDIHIWGENRGLCGVLGGVHRTILNHQEHADRAERDFEAKSSDAWIANLNPPVEGFLAGARDLLADYYATPVHSGGKRRWGFKEVRHEIGIAEFIRLLYPEAQFLLLVRHPRSCLASARATQLSWRLLDHVGGPTGFLGHWERTAKSFLRAGEERGELLLRFEDLTKDPCTWLTRLAAFLRVSPDGFRRDVFATRRRGWTDDEPRLTDEDLSALADPAVAEVARKHGYDA